MDEVSWDEVFRSNFQHAALSSHHWTKAAADLLAAASILAPHVQSVWDTMRARARGESRPLPEVMLQGVHFMLVAYAIENLLKARIVQARFSEVADQARSGKLPKLLEGHDLVELAGRVGWDPSLEEESLLRRLERCAVWYERYPTPRHSSKLGPQKFTDGEPRTLSFFTGGDLEAVEELLAKVKSL